NLFAPGQHKEFFYVFDYCQNLEFFGANPEQKEASASKSLSERLFASRLDLVRGLDEKFEKTGLSELKQEVWGSAEEPLPTEKDIRADAVQTLQDTVAGLNLDNFIVRQHRRAVEKYRAAEAWKNIDIHKREELVEEVAPLPSAHRL